MAAGFVRQPQMLVQVNSAVFKKTDTFGFEERAPACTAAEGA